MKRALFVALPLACGIAMTAMLAGCSSKPTPENVKAGLQQWLIMNFNIVARYANTPTDQIQVSVEKCFSLSDGDMDQLHLPDSARPSIKKSSQLCHVEINDGNRQYKVLLVVLKEPNGKYLAKPAAVSEASDQENKDAQILF